MDAQQTHLRLGVIGQSPAGGKLDQGRRFACDPSEAGPILGEAKNHLERLEATPWLGRLASAQTETALAGSPEAS